MKFFLIMYSVLIFLFLSLRAYSQTPLPVPSASQENGPVYNFNFYNKGAIPENSDKQNNKNELPEQERNIVENKADESRPQQPKPKENDKVEILSDSFKLKWGISETDLRNLSGPNRYGQQRYQFKGHEIGLEKEFSNGLLFGISYLFGKITTFNNIENDSGLTRITGEPTTKSKNTYSGYLANIEKNIKKFSFTNLYAGLSYSYVNFENKQYLGRDSNTIEKVESNYRGSINTYLLTVRPQINLGKYFSISLLGGYGKGKAKDAESKRFITPTTKLGLYTSVNF